MQATLTSELCPNVQVMLDLYGEHIYAVVLMNGERVLITAFTRTLCSEILRKNTHKCLQREIEEKFSVVVLDQDVPPSEEVHVMDLTSPPVHASYVAYRKRYFPITCLLEDVYQIREVYSEKEILQKLNADVSLLNEEMKSSVGWFDGNEPAIIKEYTGDGKEKGTDYSICKKVHTYSPLWYTYKNHPEALSFLALLEEFPSLKYSKAIVQLLKSPFVQPIQKDVVDQMVKDNLPNALSVLNYLRSTSLELREYFQMSQEIEDHSIFTAVTHPIYGLTHGNAKYVCLAMSRIVGGWMLDEDMDWTHCVISGSMIAATCTLLSGPEYYSVLPFYSSAYTTHIPLDGESAEMYTNHKSVRSVKHRQHVLGKWSVEGNILLANLDNQDVVFKITPGADVDMPVQVETEDELEDVAKMVHKVLLKHWPNCELSFTTEGRKTKMFQITSPIMKDYLLGFRSVELYISSKHACLGYHLPCVRGYFDGTNMYCTPSCLDISLPRTCGIKDYHYFAGKKSPESVIEKYRARGLNMGFGLSDDWILERDYNVLEEFRVMTPLPKVDKIYSLCIPKNLITNKDWLTEPLEDSYEYMDDELFRIMRKITGRVVLVEEDVY